MEEIEKLRAIGKKYLRVSMQRDLEFYLQDENLKAARAFLLGVIDAKWEHGKISDHDAREVYKQIGIPPEKAAKLRDENLHSK